MARPVAAPNSASGRVDQVLTGQNNWIRWFPGFKADARADDTWPLFDGTEQPLIKPVRNNYFTPAPHADRAIAPDIGGNESEMTGLQVARVDFEYKQAIDEYKMDLHDFEKQHERIRRANKMLHDRVDAFIQQDIQDIENPKDALDHLQTLYKMQDSRAIQHTYSQIDALTLQKCPSMTVYLNTLRQLENDLNQLGETFTDAQLLNKIVKGLPQTYASWVDRYHDIMADPDATKPSVKSIEAQLLAKELTIPIRTTSP